MARRWLRGDFHAHTLYSDGVLTPAQFLVQAEREELDFFAITDHNTWTFPEFDAPDHMAIIAGVEVTMDYGHFNVFAEDDAEPAWIAELPRPWPLREPDAPPGGSRELLERIKREGLRSSINHPLLYPWEWLDAATALEDVRYVEVWNDPTWPENQVANPAALAMWSRWLDAGSRATALGGSDFHDPEAGDRGDGWIVRGHRVGCPRTYVEADSNNPTDILRAVDDRRVFVTMGPTVDMSVDIDGHEFGIGSELGERSGVASLEVSALGEGNLVVQLLKDGAVVASAEGKGGAGAEHKEPLEGTGWMRADVRDAVTGQVIAFTNPIFFGLPPSPGRTYGEFIDDTGWDLISGFAQSVRPPGA